MYSGIADRSAEMTSAGDVAPAEQLCYIPCTFCNIVLAVGVPCSSMFDMVTVRCGHCTKLWSVNMAAAAFHSLSTSASSSRPPTAADLLLQAPTSTDYGVDLGSSSSSRCFSNKIPTETMPLAAADRRVVNRPPEKRQRVPSAYNQFIKEEIRRIKANNPEISHREAFSTAAKNWAHFPHIHFGLMLESNKDSSKQDGAGDEWN